MNPQIEQAIHMANTLQPLASADPRSLLQFSVHGCQARQSTVGHHLTAALPDWQITRRHIETPRGNTTCVEASTRGVRVIVYCTPDAKQTKEEHP